ncbi:glycoside hydrolase family 130 protein [Sphingomonas qomolangmaensis]|uniref:Glycoside hydrolase family 130 protein n=1 Tax=Sphingomonas qomolangmaensis TaxID=2918765 RepID=A0ABY5L856_9SPHN|nr:glycoside hydrolase family 130 protein [Sphingomonas qomolangmaensis]UUL83155.1 glycoside hydrolase family 130 protein [Sphingomonas qomolangmaensis]
MPAVTPRSDPIDADLMTRIDLELCPAPARVVLRPFVPAESAIDADPRDGSRVEHILRHVLALDSAGLDAELDWVVTSLATRHRDVERLLQRRFEEMADRFLAGRSVSPGQALLAGAYFAEEYAFEAVALFNPSIVAHPDQSGVEPGALRFVLSLRGVGEGHVSSVSFRTGQISAQGTIAVDPLDRWATSPVIDRIAGDRPDDPALGLDYGPAGDIAQVVIFPISFQQRHGIEDLRLVRFTDDDGRATYLGTYTAFSGETVRQELLRTDDFVTFELDALRGGLSASKGMALFPRRLDGQYAMLGRHDHENIWLLKSDDLYRWDRGSVIVSPQWPWEFIQIGNCGSPIEIDEGWLVITHGVGPIRNYCLGACLLDKHDPSKLIARSTRPLIRPSNDTREGYVPNVVYSCGAIVLGRALWLPYGVADSFTAFATVPLDALLAGMA